MRQAGLTPESLAYQLELLYAGSEFAADESGPLARAIHRMETICFQYRCLPSHLAAEDPRDIDMLLAGLAARLTVRAASMDDD